MTMLKQMEMIQLKNQQKLNRNLLVCILTIDCIL